jgi:hypothetical protein
MDHTKIQVGAGFEIRGVLTGFESPWVIIDQLCTSTPIDALRALLETFGPVSAMNSSLKLTASMTVRAQFVNPDAAMKAAVALNGTDLFGRRATVRLPLNNSKNFGVWDDTCVRLTWPAPNKIGFAGYQTLKAAQEVIESSRGTLRVRGLPISAALHDGVPSLASFTVRFQGLHPQTTAKDLKRVGQPEAVMLGQPNYQSLDHAIGCIRNLLEEIGEVLAFDVQPPPSADKMVRLWAHFTSPAKAKELCESLHNRHQRFLGKEKLFARHLKTVSYALPVQFYDVLASDLDALFWNARQQLLGTAISVVDRRKHGLATSTVLIKISGENVKDLGRLKHAFEKLYRGEIVKVDGEPLWDNFFATGPGSVYLSELERRYPEVEIRRDSRRRTVTLFGCKEKHAMIVWTLVEHIRKLQTQKLHVISLGRNFLGIFMSAELQDLQRELGLENVAFNLGHRTLVVRGSDDARDAVQQAVEKAQKCFPAENQCESSSDCPVCLGESVSPITLPCKHKWCKSCLVRYLISAPDVKSFPVTCLGDQAKCSQPLPISVARDILTAAQFDALVQAAFLAHVHSHPQEFHYCPTPDCPQVYRKGPRDAVLQCPSCLARICPKCHTEYHDGARCEDEGDDLFQQWADSHDVKNCPGCQAPIQRDEGCNHITCIRCQTHICWVCMDIFPKGDGIYDHMRAVHGGIGL